MAAFYDHFNEQKYGDAVKNVSFFRFFLDCIGVLGKHFTCKHVNLLRAKHKVVLFPVLLKSCMSSVKWLIRSFFLMLWSDVESKEEDLNYHTLIRIM